ncbi:MULTISPECIES: hypothetical protein [Bradyrhizobium]|uniref:hypothetical protein n=1 Tax=Bradyrhizobium TaxID=374 RepID=UPI0013E8C83D|nr:MULTISPECIES: hypothetical protein [Bradyrhizobium]
MFDLDEIDRWRARRHAPNMTPSAQLEPELSMGERFATAMRKRHKAGENRRRND